MFAVAEFGSTVRRDSDATSDKDLLVVGKGRCAYEAQRRYESLGYAVSTYSPAQLVHMRDAGSLFVQHLKAESRILVDPKNRFSTFLRGCEFQAPTSTEVTKCVRSLMIAFSSPTTSHVSLWKYDFLYCLARDYLIKRTASANGVFFGLNDLERECFDHWGISEVEFAPMRILRRYKSAHRNGVRLLLPDENAEQGLYNLLVRTGLFARTQPKRSNFVEVIRRARNLGASYVKLRVLEGAYKSLWETEYSHPDHPKLVALLTKPNYSRSTSKFRREVVDNYLRDIQAELTANKSVERTLDRSFPSLPLRSVAVKRRSPQR